jgi:hypothetical protein
MRVALCHCDAWLLSIPEFMTAVGGSTDQLIAEVSAFRVL